MMIQRTYQIPDMHCSACVMRLEGLEDLAGVQSAQASYHKQTLQVEFDDQVIGEPQLLQAIQKLGYSVAGI